MIFLSTRRAYPIESLRALPLNNSSDNRFDIPNDVLGSGYSSQGINELFPLHGARSLYGTTKLCAEHYITEYSSMYGVEAVTNRCGILSGPWQMGKVDQGVMTLWMARHFFGGNLKYIGFGVMGQQVRDALHVDDLCDLVHTQMESISEHAGAIYNVGGGLNNSASLNQLTQICQDISRQSVDIGSAPSTHPADIPYYVSDCSQVMQAAQWDPQRSVSRLLEDIHAWLKKNQTMLEPILAPKGLTS